MASNPTEPAADLRQMAAALWQMYVALTNEGFTERQALVMIGQMMAAGQHGGASE
jgi:hypothetical protein